MNDGKNAWDNDNIIVAPSILAADFGKMADEIKSVVAAGADWLHLDVMDGHFVPNISFGPAMVAMCRREVDVFLDVHLMLSHPDKYIAAFADAGADCITVHVEADHEIHGTLSDIRSRGIKAGVAVNPATSLESVREYADEFDLLLCMTVVPGFGGQSFMPEVLEKITAAEKWRADTDANWLIEVDGGIDIETAKRTTVAGARALVAGTSVFGAADRAAAISGLRG